MESKSQKKLLITVILIIIAASFIIRAIIVNASYDTFEQCYRTLIGNKEIKFSLDGTDSKLVTFEDQGHIFVVAFVNKDARWYMESISMSNTIFYHHDKLACRIFEVNNSSDRYISVSSSTMDLDDNVLKVEDNLGSQFQKTVYPQDDRTYFYACIPAQIAYYELYVGDRIITQQEFNSFWSEHISKPEAFDSPMP